MDSKNYTALKSRLNILNQGPYSSHSRIHPLKSFSNPNTNCLIKRDDELSFSISGSKIRKYLSLMPRILEKNVKHVMIIGGAFSNHVLGLSQLVIENGMKPVLFLRQAGGHKVQGNRFFIEMLVNKDQIQWISRAEWPNVEQIAREYIHNNKIDGFIVPEGACMKESLPGALSLAMDIVTNESEHQMTFDHIVIDSGTGLQAIALILGMHCIAHPTRIHVIQLAEHPERFIQKLHHFFDDALFKGLHDNSLPNNFEQHFPVTASSFGSVNSRVFNTITSFAREEGVFLDPIYTAKAFMTGHHLINENRLNGNVLFIHSGGAFSLSGFQDEAALVSL